MKLSKPYLLICTILLLLATSCGESKKKKTDTATQTQKQNKSQHKKPMGSYDIHISGGSLDGKTFSGKVSNDIHHGGGSGFLSKENKDYNKNQFTMKVQVDVGNEKRLTVQGTYPVDNNNNAMPMGTAKDFYKKSVMQVSFLDKKGDSRIGLQSKSGSVKISNIDMEGNKSSLFRKPDFNVHFDGIFGELIREKNNYREEDVSITGDIEIRNTK